ncbi:hypothetical protein COU54_04980 [Candidatus Pacearchaeota archaeon CG10_big_fil_rev_8_21_14_0_10_31_24]|nr:MAG: hypothetical protein COU54_04980 [Candidatus Pacearchaeota archaeon CG10_big_fil_rev_8_21_14_0_10_31_24]
MKNKNGFEMSFGMIFSIIVGGIIIFLAVYATNSLFKTEKRIVDSESSQELSNILNPLSTSIESGSKPGNITFNVESKIENNCLQDGKLGTQEISVSSRSGIGKPWQGAGIPSKSSGSYIFSERELQGKEFFTLIKPINLPFKVGDIVLLWNNEYCFVEPPRIIEEDIIDFDLNTKKMKIVSSLNECSKNSKKVCFDSGGVYSDSCDSIVNVDAKRVVKNKKIVYYEDNLILGAVISDPEIYECQVSRILNRAGAIASVYIDKSELVSSKSGGCSSAMQPDLIIFKSQTENSSSKDLYNLLLLSEKIENSNKNSICPLWKEKII